jgi:hypothetical protein
LLLVIAACAGESPPAQVAESAPSTAPATRALGDLVLEPDEVLDLPAEVACDTCRLELGEEFALSGAEADGGTPGGVAGIARMADGRFAAALARAVLPGLGYYQFADADTLIRGWEDPETGIYKLAATEFTFQR